MTKIFTYLGGPKDKVTTRIEEPVFPEVHDGGEYRWTGNAHGSGAAAPEGPFPEADRATATWFADARP